MNVAIALASSSGQISGVPKHGINLARCLLTRHEISDLHLVAAPWQQEFVRDALPSGEQRLHLHAAHIGNNTVSRNLWFYSELPKLAKRLEADIVHLAYPVPVRRGAFHCPVVVTLHDMYPYDIPENFGFPKVLFNRVILRQCLQRVDAIACVSQATYSRLENRASLFARKASVVYNSVERRTRLDSGIPRPEWGRPPFLLCVAQHRRNKNILLVLKVFHRLLRAGHIPAEMRLLIVGIAGPETKAIESFIAASDLAHSVVLLNGISDAQLQWCYRNCGLLLAPSVQEGFGLPIAEASLIGCRVVCSDIPAFRELGCSHCRFVPLGSQEVEAFADAVRATLLDSLPAPVALPKFSLPVIGEEYLRLYQSLLPAPAAQTRSRQTLSDAKETEDITYDSRIGAQYR